MKSHFSPEAQSILSGLLQRDVNNNNNNKFINLINRLQNVLGTVFRKSKTTNFSKKLIGPNYMKKNMMHLLNLKSKVTLT